MDSKDEIDKKEEEIFCKRALRIIHEIVKVSSDGEYIYRGQSGASRTKSRVPLPHQVTSTLYREMVEICPEIIDAPWLNVNHVQKEALKVARKFAGEEFASEGYDNKKMLSRIQHYAGDTNLIDFTKDYLVALFFACSRKYGKKDGEDGKVFLLEIAELKDREKASEIDGEIEMITPVHPPNRVIAQKSVFIQPRTGIIPNKKMKVVTIPLALKQPILDYLETRHDISLHTIYNDLHGYIRSHKEHGNAVMEFYVGLSYSDKSNNAQSREEKRNAASEAIRHYSNAIQLEPQYASAYNNRGNARRELGEVSDAIDWEGVMKDYDKSIELDPNDAAAYNNRGNAKRDMSEVSDAIDWEGVRKDYDKSIELDPDYAGAYYNRGFANLSCGDAKWKSGDRQGVISDYKKAIKDYKESIKLNPKYAKAYNNYAIAKRKLGDVSGAIDYEDIKSNCDKAIDLDPDFAMAYYNRGLAKEELGGRQNFQEALSDFEIAKQLASQQNDQEIADDAQKGIERVTVEIKKL